MIQNVLPVNSPLRPEHTQRMRENKAARVIQRRWLEEYYNPNAEFKRAVPHFTRRAAAWKAARRAA